MAKTRKPQMSYVRTFLAMCIHGLMAAFLTCASFAQPLSLEKVDFGFYSGDAPEVQLIFDSLDDNDIRINCYSELRCKISSRVPTESVDSAGVLKLASIKPLLQASKHKRLLFISLEKTIMKRGPDVVRRVVRAFLEMTKDTGFKRVVILGAAGNGVHYLADTARKDLEHGTKGRENHQKPD